MHFPILSLSSDSHLGLKEAVTPLELDPSPAFVVDNERREQGR